MSSPWIIFLTLVISYSIRSVFLAMCAAGSYSEDGVEPTCRKCDYGWYQENQGSNNCTQCPNGTTTFERGSVNSSSCKGMLFPELEVSDVLMRFFSILLTHAFFHFIAFFKKC